MKTEHPRTKRQREELADMLAKIFSRRYHELKKRFSFDFSLDPGVKPEHLRILRRNGRIVAHVGIYEKPIRIGRAVLRMGGVGGVACEPEFRNRGFASACLKSAIQTMQKEGMPISFLFGIDRFYTKFGYVGCLPRYSMKIPRRELICLKNAFDAKPYTRRDIEDLVRLYEAASRDTPASVVRDAQRFAAAIERNGLSGTGDESFIYVFRERHSPHRARAYAVWKDGSLWEAGLEPGDRESCDALLAWLCQKSEGNELNLTGLSPSHPLWKYARRFEHVIETNFSWTGGGMGRIVDVGKFLEVLAPELEARANAAGLEAEYQLRLVVDGVPHELILGRSHQFSSSARLVISSTVECSQQALLQMAIGSLHFECIPGVTVRGERALVEAVFPESSPCIYRLDAF